MNHLNSEPKNNSYGIQYKSFLRSTHYPFVLEFTVHGTDVELLYKTQINWDYVVSMHQAYLEKVLSEK